MTTNPLKPLDIIDLGRRQPITDPVVKAVLNAVCARSDPYGVCWPKQETLMADTALSERSVRKALCWLETEGFLVRTIRRYRNGVRRSDLTTLDLAKLQACAVERHDVPVVREAATGSRGHSNRHVEPQQPAPRAGFTTFEQTREHPVEESPLNPPASGGPARSQESGSREVGATAPQAQPDPRRESKGVLPPASEERFTRLLGVYPRDGVTLANLDRARRHFGGLGEAEQLQAIAAATAYRELLTRRPDTPVKALHGWLRQGRYRNAGQIQTAAVPAEAQPTVFLSRYSPHWTVADAAHRRTHGRPLPAFHEHRGNAGRWMAMAELPPGYDPDPQDLRTSPAAIAAGSSAYRAA